MGEQRLWLVSRSPSFWHTLATRCTCSRSSACGSSLEPSPYLPHVFLDSRNGRMLAPSLCTPVRLHRAWYVASMTPALSSGPLLSSPFSHLLRGRFDRKAVPSASSFPQSRSRESHRFRPLKPQ